MDKYKKAIKKTNATQKVTYYCSICEKQVKGYYMPINNRKYFICKNSHKTFVHD